MSGVRLCAGEDRCHFPRCLEESEQRRIGQCRDLEGDPQTRGTGRAEPYRDQMTAVRGPPPTRRGQRSYPISKGNRAAKAEKWRPGDRHRVCHPTALRGVAGGEFDAALANRRCVREQRLQGAARCKGVRPGHGIVGGVSSSPCVTGQRQDSGIDSLDAAPRAPSSTSTRHPLLTSQCHDGT